MSNSSSKGAGTWMMAGDVGGTNTRIGLFNPSDYPPALEKVETFPSRNFSGLESIVEKFLRTRKVSVGGACFGMAGPVENGRCRATNIPWEVSERRLKKTFSWPVARLINDLAAMAHATRVLRSRELCILQKGRRDNEGARAVVAPGTGLGMSLMIKDRDQFICLPSEGGHADFAPTREEEIRLWRHIRQSTGHVSAERIVSGPGLENIYRWLANESEASPPAGGKIILGNKASARAISDAALNGEDPLCEKALEIFVSILGAVAGNLALTGLPFGGLYIGGGIVPKIMPFLRKKFLLDSFLDKGRFRNLLLNIPVYVILNDLSALLGASVVLQSLLDRGSFPDQ